MPLDTACGLERFETRSLERHIHAYLITLTDQARLSGSEQSVLRSADRVSAVSVLESVHAS